LVADGVARDDSETAAAPKLDAKAAANRITSEAYRRGSTDNITAVVVAVDWGREDVG
jgi:serine/threonine protein phosphatase PrpC